MTTTDDTVKTRKNHECRVCGEIAPAGETMIRRAGFDNDGPWTIHMHPECERLTGLERVKSIQSRETLWFTSPIHALAWCRDRGANFVYTPAAPNN